MVCYKKTNKKLLNSSDGSSLAIALFFFMVCALMCAGIIFLANSTTRGVSKSLSVAKNQTYVEPSGMPTLTPSPPPLEGYVDESNAIDYVYDVLYYDYYYSMLTVENGGQLTIKKSPKNIPYEIFSYINDNIYKKMDNPNDHQNNQDDFDHPVIPDAEGNLTVDFTITVNDMSPVKVTVDMTGIQSTTNHGNDVRVYGIKFKTLKMTVESAVEGTGCSYVRYFEYVVPDGENYVIQNVKDGSSYKFLIYNKP